MGFLVNISILKMSWAKYGWVVDSYDRHSSCVSVVGRCWGGRQVPPRDGLFVQDEVDSTSRVATFVRADRLEKIIMLANIRDDKKWVTYKLRVQWQNIGMGKMYARTYKYRNCSPVAMVRSKQMSKRS